MSASVTFLTLPGLDDITRVAGFVAIILSASSMMSAVIALFRYKSDIERSSYAGVGGEGMIMLSVCPFDLCALRDKALTATCVRLQRRSVLLSLPLVFLIWSVAAFLTGIGLYACRGLSVTSAGEIVRHFKDYTQWAVIGVAGGLASLLMISTLLL